MSLFKKIIIILDGLAWILLNFVLIPKFEVMILVQYKCIRCSEKGTTREYPSPKGELITMIPVCSTQVFS